MPADAAVPLRWLQEVEEEDVSDVSDDEEGEEAGGWRGSARRQCQTAVIRRRWRGVAFVWRQLRRQLRRRAHSIIHTGAGTCTRLCTARHTSVGPAPALLAGEEGERRGKQSRSEKKSRKAVQKLGMKPVPGVMRVQIKKSKNVRGRQEGRAGGKLLGGRLRVVACQRRPSRRPGSQRPHPVGGLRRSCL